MSNDDGERADDDHQEMKQNCGGCVVHASFEGSRNPGKRCGHQLEAIPGPAVKFLSRAGEASLEGEDQEGSSQRKMSRGKGGGEEGEREWRE
eukprot:762455-Hanusia_phi.AAC.1